MQAVFVDNWIKATGRVLHGAEYFPKLSNIAGDMDAQMFGSSPVGGSESMHLMVLLALTAAKTSIDIENAYFVPDKLTVEALCSAARRGVRVRIVVPGRYTDCARRALGGAGTVWRVARRRNPDLRISADDDAL
jgi:cardiolipin synthase